LYHLAIHDQGMAFVREHMAQVAWQCWMGLGFPAQQSDGIGAGTVGLVAELDAAEVAFRPLLAWR
jgi:hypothetical protein